MEDCAKLRLRQAAVRLVRAAMIRHLNGAKLIGRGNGCCVAWCSYCSWGILESGHGKCCLGLSYFIKYIQTLH